MQILVVEDEKRLSDALCHILREQKYMVDAVADGDEGYDYAKSGIYDCIILDVMLPGKNGFEIAAQDLAMRGPGELTGIRQSGALAFSDFDLYRDAALAPLAAEAAERILDGSISMTEGEQFRLRSYCEDQQKNILL